MSVQPINSFTDSTGVSWLRLSNGHKVRLPDAGGATGPYVLKAGDTMTGALGLKYQYPAVTLDSDPAGYSQIVHSRVGSPRWINRIVNNTETATDGEGNDWQLIARNNDGTQRSAPVTVIRQTGTVNFSAHPTVTGQTGTVVPAAGWAIMSGYSGYITRFGLICIMTVNLNRTGANIDLTNWTTVASIPTEFWPDANTQGAGGISGARPVWTFLATSGVLQLKMAAAEVVNTNQYASINLSWRVT